MPPILNQIRVLYSVAMAATVDRLARVNIGDNSRVSLQAEAGGEG